MGDGRPGRDWTRIRERGSMWGLRLTVACYRALGPVLTLPLVYAVVAYFFATDPTGRAASRRFLARIAARSDTGVGESPSEAREPGLWQSFLHYREFALSIADRIGLWGGREEDFEFAFSGREHFDRLHAEGRGAILYGAHLGSFDALRVLSVADGVPVNVLMYTRHAAKINAIFRELGPGAELRVIAADDDAATTALRIKACLDRAEHVAILADRVEPNDRHRARWIDFLGAPAPFPIAPFELPLLFGAPALLVLALRDGRRRYAVHVEMLADPYSPVPRARRPELVEKLARGYVSRLEHYCVRAPRQWFNFYDVWEARAEAS